MKYDKVSDIVLRKNEQAVFDLFADDGTAILTESQYHLLRGKHLVDPSLGWPEWPNEGGTVKVELTEVGLDLQAYQALAKAAEARTAGRFRTSMILSVLSLVLAGVGIFTSIATASDISRLKRWLNIEQAQVVETEPEAPLETARIEAAQETEAPLQTQASQCIDEATA